MTTIERTELFKQQHQGWLKLDITKAFLATLDKHERFIVDALASASMSKDKTDAQVRLMSVQLNTTQHIKKLAHDTETFIAKCQPD